jgi:thymidine kinase
MLTKQQLTMSQNKREGKIILIIGPMFSGKTSEALRQLSRYEIAGLTTIAVKKSFDTRYSLTEIVSHDRVTRREAEVVEGELLPKIESIESDVIAIDEGQFFSDIAEAADLLASRGKIVIVSALDGDHKRRPFGNVYKLIPLAEIVIKLQAVCTLCGKDAPFTSKKVSGGDLIDVGNEDKYFATCRSCHSMSTQAE